MTSLYMINPRPQERSYDSVPGFVSTPDLAIITVAAMAPPHWTVSVCEEAVTGVDLETTARFVGLTGKNTQLPRMVELAAAFRARGKTVLIGGPLASLEPETLRPHADVLVTGEMEDISAGLFADLEAGTWKSHYEGGRPDLRSSPVPRWDLYPVERALTGALQTTRGCPFECEFCDVIMYNGRKQRHKDVSQVLAELDVLYSAGFRQVFLTDDNFTVHRQFARTMLDAFAGWNAEHAQDPIHFVTQASLDIARDTDMLERCVAAGLTHLFIGIETVNPESLRETRKRQNLLLPPLEAVQRIVSQGILIRNGIMVGFDHDGPDIFDILFDFLQSAPLMMPGINVLIASPGTPLHARLKREGRLLEDGHRWVESMNCNFVPKRMSGEQLVSGALDLAQRLYTPAAFEQRAMNFISLFGSAAAQADQSPRSRPAPDRKTLNQPGVIRGASQRTAYAMSCMRRTAARGAQEAAMVSRVTAAAAGNTARMRGVITALVYYEQHRAYLDYVVERLPQAA